MDQMALKLEPMEDLKYIYAYNRVCPIMLDVCLDQFSAASTVHF